MTVQFTQPRSNAPRGKLAEVELNFTSEEGPLLNGLKISGFTVWAKKDGSGLFLELPGRAYEAADGKKKTFDYLRYQGDRDKAAHDNLKNLILQEYEHWSTGGR